jgi:hypothetical protein
MKITNMGGDVLAILIDKKEFEQYVIKANELGRKGYIVDGVGTWDDGDISLHVTNADDDSLNFLIELNTPPKGGGHDDPLPNKAG